MIDYKFSNITGITTQEVYNNELLDFISTVNLKTGELTPPGNRNRNKVKYIPRKEQRVTYQFLTISIVNDKYINFQGSYHEYFSNGENYTDFFLSDLYTVIKDLHYKFNFNPLYDLIHNVEFGVNVKLPFDTKTFLKSILSFKGKEYQLREFKGGGLMLKFEFDQYELKIYDKGFQYKLPENLLRFEIKVTTMEFLRSKGIHLHTSKDLLLPAIYTRMGDLLTDFFNQLVIYDHSIKLKSLNDREQRLLREGQNPKYWSKLKDTNPENYKKKLKRFKELVYKRGKEKRQETVSKLINDKWNELTQITQECQKEIDNYLQSLEPKTFPKITDLHKTDIPQNNTSNSVLNWGNFISPSTKIATLTPKGETSTGVSRFCLSCGRDISNQKTGSIFCSERLYGRHGKKCRNSDSNPRNNFKNREKRIKNGGLLFEIDSYLISNFVH